jgi:hypothetical protein
VIALGLSAVGFDRPAIPLTAFEVLSWPANRCRPFINVAVAEKLAHLEHEEWARKRKQQTKALAARALNLLKGQ